MKDLTPKEMAELNDWGSDEHKKKVADLVAPSRSNVIEMPKTCPDCGGAWIEKDADWEHSFWCPTGQRHKTIHRQHFIANVFVLVWVAALLAVVVWAFIALK